MELVGGNIATLGGKVIASASDIVDPKNFSSLSKGTPIAWVEPRYIFGKDVALPSNGTAIGNSSPDTRIVDLLNSSRLLSQATSANRPSFVSSSKQIDLSTTAKNLQNSTDYTTSINGITSCLLAFKGTISATYGYAMVAGLSNGSSYNIVLNLSGGVFSASMNSANSGSGGAENRFFGPYVAGFPSIIIISYDFTTKQVLCWTNGVKIPVSNTSLGTYSTGIGSVLFLNGSQILDTSAATYKLDHFYIEKNGTYTDAIIQKLNNYLNTI